MLRCAFTGSNVYYAWIALLVLLTASGLAVYVIQLRVGLAVTNLTQQVSWGAYIANFTFLVGVAAAAVLLVVPTYVYHREDIREVVLIAELMAATAIVMCLLFVTVDLGRPERFIHFLPFLGRLNFPLSMLAWDVIVLTGYLLLNLHVPGYLLYQLYRGRQPAKAAYLPFVFLSIFWAISIHTVTAFLYGGFGGRPFWNTAIMAPRFLVSAFASGPAILILVFVAIDRFTDIEIRESIFKFLRRVISIALPLNFFLLGCELFKEFYTDSVHTASAEYLFFGLFGHGLLVPYIWSALAMSGAAIVIFSTERLYRDRRWLIAGSALCVLGVWIEKGMGLIIPGFIPTPTGDLVEYTPSAGEFLICLGIWAFGALIFTAMAKVALAIQHGRLRAQT
ncbi:MAG: polysulfide reductase NrfD [Proteobacteria bacterium]|nr:polysulfide reductase NrfD [Pseudomonadota bacterium]